MRGRRRTEFAIVHQTEKTKMTEKAEQKEVTKCEQWRLNDGSERCVGTG